MSKTSPLFETFDPGWSWDDKLSLSHAVRANGLIYVSGQLPVDSAGALVGAGSMEAQARQVFANINAVLKSAGCGLDRVVRLTCYVTDFSDYGAYSRVRGEIFGARPPASTTVGVAKLLVPGALLEVDATALA